MTRQYEESLVFTTRQASDRHNESKYYMLKHGPNKGGDASSPTEVINQPHSIQLEGR